MKGLWVLVVLLIALFFSLPYHLYLRMLWKKNPEKSWKKARKYVSGFFKKELKISGCDIEVLGKENIPEDVPALFVSNHRSYFDILITHETIGKPAGFIAKKELRKVPLLPLIWMISAVFSSTETILSKVWKSLIRERNSLRWDILWFFFRRDTEIRVMNFSHLRKADIRWQKSRNVRLFLLL